ncbi:MAG TPA: M90 family metallopeptidase [Aquihabitans sp.]|nr:M90 family metallopeptidase [Aquihabitans sp.]
MRFPRRRSRAELAPDWRQLVERHVAHWRLLDDDERDRLAGLLEAIVTTKRWEPAQGFELTDRVRTVIAAQAALLVLELDLDHYRDVGSIIVHPSTMRFDTTSEGPVPGTEVCGSVDLLGEAAYGGPVVIAWDSASAAARHPARGHDVVLHEFAHKLDMLDGTVDGTPPLEGAALARWVEVCTREYVRLRDGDEDDDVLDDYGATDAGEFFAVATESFFTVPIDLEVTHPGLYDVLRGFYRQDPAERVRRRSA